MTNTYDRQDQSVLLLKSKLLFFIASEFGHYFVLQLVMENLVLYVPSISILEQVK